MGDPDWAAAQAEARAELELVDRRWREFLASPLGSLQRGNEPDAAATGRGASSGGEEEAENSVGRQTAATRLLQLACVAVFAAQWAPIVQAIACGAPAMGRDLLLAAAVACPPTPLTLSWQADAISVVSGELGCLFASALLHSGLLSLVASLWSLEQTAPFLETLHGFVIMLVSYMMAGVGAAGAQLLFGGQPAAIGGLGAAVGMEAAVAVRYWRSTRTLLAPSLACVVLAGIAALSAVYQPLVGPWGVAGGFLGGALSGVLAYDVLWLMRVVLGVTILLGVGVWNLISWFPRFVWRLLLRAFVIVWSVLAAVVAAVRGV